jgi:acyl carrier protein
MTTTTDQRRQEILSIIAYQSDRPNATEASTLGVLDMDSLDTVELIFAIEDKYLNAIEIDDDLWGYGTTVREIIDDVIAMLDA